MTIKVKMTPYPKKGDAESGIKRVIEAYFKYLPEHGFEFVEPGADCYDLHATHAGMTGGDCDVAHLHGLYWGDRLDHWQRKANANIVEAIRNAKCVTVPSEWVAETIRRDCRFNPYILPHGIDYELWNPSNPIGNYVLWNKNRPGDVCSPEALGRLANKFKNVKFVSTYKPEPNSDNIKVTGVLPHNEMKSLIEGCGVYLSTAKETFGIGVLEAMAAGRPVVGWNWGGNIDLIRHGINGYLAEPSNYEDLFNGLRYCLQYGKTLGENGRELVKQFGWDKAIAQLADIYKYALTTKEEQASVAIIIPVYNKSPELVERAIQSALNQKTDYKIEVVIVNDGSTENYDELRNKYNSGQCRWVDKSNGGVATARNEGIQAAIGAKYICCLDADDWIEENFIDLCVRFLEDDPTYGIAFTGLTTHTGNNVRLSEWPNGFDYDKQIDYVARQNQVPTCCVFRREAWKRIGGFRQRYAPHGAGSEDAAFWSAIGSIGYKGFQVTPKGLFHYTAFEGNVSGNREYQEKDWLAWYPWSRDGKHPFVSVATPKDTAHVVREYDDPLISIVVPVGPGHEKYLFDLIDSVEAQYLREWELIVVFDSDYDPTEILTPYPFVRVFHTEGNQGPGTARNIGANNARGNFLLFIDADDLLNVAYPDALNKMVQEYKINGAAIYTDYIGRSFVQDEDKLASDLKNNIVGVIKGEYFIRHKSPEYNRDHAIVQPKTDANNRVYHWCNITTLIPRQWHFDIGGFDENLETWEDVEYWWRIAKAGKCFEVINEPYLIYRFYSGGRRAQALADIGEGRQKWQDVIKYIEDRHKDVEIVACDCGKKQKKVVVPTLAAQSKETSMEDSEFVLVEFHFQGEETRSDYGRALKSVTGIRGPDDRPLDYGGYGRKAGDTFLVHKDDQKARPDMFRLISEKVPPKPSQPVQEPKPINDNGGNYDVPGVEAKQEIKEPTKLVDTSTKYKVEFDPELVEPELSEAELEKLELEKIPGMSTTVLESLLAAGYDTREKILKAGYDKLVNIKGIGDRRATVFLGYLQEQMEKAG